MTIQTSYSPPPIPVRHFDWSAVLEGYEPGDPIGRGVTEQEAIDDLKDCNPPQGFSCDFPKASKSLKRRVQMRDGSERRAPTESVNMSNTTWPFPPFPNPKDTGNRVPKFNPDDHEDAPL